MGNKYSLLFINKDTEGMMRANALIFRKVDRVLDDEDLKEFLKKATKDNYLIIGWAGLLFTVEALPEIVQRILCLNGLVHLYLLMPFKFEGRVREILAQECLKVLAKLKKSNKLRFLCTVINTNNLMCFPEVKRNRWTIGETYNLIDEAVLQIVQSKHSIYPREKRCANLSPQKACALVKRRLIGATRCL